MGYEILFIAQLSNPLSPPKKKKMYFIVRNNLTRGSVDFVTSFTLTSLKALRAYLQLLYFPHFFSFSHFCSQIGMHRNSRENLIHKRRVAIMLSLDFAANIITYVNWKVSLDYISWGGYMKIWTHHVIWINCLHRIHRILYWAVLYVHLLGKKSNIIFRV